jgi:hypothetical protein
MDEKIIIYLVLGLVYFLFNALRKKNKGAGQEEESSGPYRQEQQERPPQGRRPLTFEELLKEISEGKSQQPKPSTEYVDYDDNIGEEAQDLEDVTIDYSKTDPTYEIYERAKQEAFARPSLETSTEAERNIQFGKFKEFEEVKGETLLEKYTRELRDPEGFKKAIILSEVLNRKHF